MTKKIAICAANYVGNEIVKYLKAEGHFISLAITCKEDRYEKEISENLSDMGVHCLRKKSANSKEFIKELHDRKIDQVLLLWWPEIIKEETLKSNRLGIINLHPSFLPTSRGKHPYYWSIVEEKDFGVSIHYITTGIDDGKIIAQKKIEFDITSTGEELYEKSLSEMISLFKDTFPKIKEHNPLGKDQNSNESTFHFGKELNNHSRIHLEKEYNALELINIMRARTFAGKESSFFLLDGKKYYINIDIYEA
jgi:methionyl-tRNA formyltransferase